MSTEDLRLDQLEAMSSDLRSKRSDLFEHVNRWRDERDRINESSRKMREEAQKHKEDRDKINARVAEDVVDLIGLEEVVDGHHHRPRVQDAKHRGDEFGTVLEPQPDAVAGLYFKPLLELVRDEGG